MTPRHAALLAAAAARIVPADEYPSAADAGAVEYVRRLLDGDLRGRAGEMAVGLDAVDAAARVTDGCGFADASPERQDAALTAMENDADPAVRRFVAWLVELVLESYYADPANGGNAGAVSWKMIGYDPRVPGYDGGRA